MSFPSQKATAVAALELTDSVSTNHNEDLGSAEIVESEQQGWIQGYYKI